MTKQRWVFCLLVMVGWLLPVAVSGASAREDTWLKVVTPEFTVVTSLPEAQARAWSAEFAQYVAALRALLHSENRRMAPLTIVLFARPRDFQRFRPLDEKGKVKEVDGFFLRHESWSVAGMAGAEQKEDTRSLIFHEGVHWFLSSQERPNPVWLEEGIAELFSTFNVRKREKDVEWGRPIDNHVELLNYAQPLPLAQLLSTARADLFGDDSMRTSIVYAESWAFVHYVLFGKHKLPHDALPQFLNAMQRGELQEAAFRSAFGRTYADLDKELYDYMRGGQFFVRRMALIEVPAPTVEPAARPDVENALARLALAARRLDDAAAHARAAIAAAPDDPRGHEVLGLILTEQEQKPAARAEFNAAIERGSRDFMPFFAVAMAMQNDAIENHDLTPANARTVANLYERAINLRPRYLASYENLAGVIGVAEPWGKNDRDFFEFGAKLFPDEPMIRIGLAILTHRGGDAPAARQQLAEVLKNDDLKTSTRTYARQLEDSWEAEGVQHELEQLMDSGKLAEALALVDRQLDSEIGRPLRMQLLVVQKDLRARLQGKAFEDALHERRWVDARKIGNEILESNANPGLKMQVRRFLEDLNRRKLGLPEPEKSN